MSPGLAYGLIWVGFALYLAVLAQRRPLPPRGIWALVGLLVAIFTVAPVLLSNDVYSYLDYARLGVVHGLDPYVHPPSAVPTDPIYPEVRWTEATSVYGPLFTLLTYPLAWLGTGAGIAVLKLLAAASVLGTAYLAGRIAAARGAEPARAVAFVALNPLVLVHVVGGAHNDGLAMLPAMAAIAALLASRSLAAGAGLVAATAIKLPAAVLVPFALLSQTRPTPPPMGRFPAYVSPYRPIGGAGWLVLGAIVAAGAIGVAAVVAFGWDWLGALNLAGESQSRTSHMSVPITVSRLTGLGPDLTRTAAFLLYGFLVAGLLVWTWRGADWLRAAGWASLGLLLATAWLLPWYLIWVLPLAAISRDRPLQLLALALTAFQLTTRIPV